jgi:hypothetical protein
MATGRTVDVAFIDIEASGLGPQSFPIEVGWALLDGVSGSVLIKPASGWISEAWDEAAEGLHGIPWAQLTAQGQSAWAVADKLNGLLNRCILVLSDAPQMDGFWLDRLFDQTSADRRFELTEFDRCIRRTFPRFDLDAALIDADDSRAHRAQADALLLRRVWQTAAN